MRRHSNIDLTPLLDVILLLIFGFMFVLASTNTQLADVKQDLQKATQQTTATIATLQDENADLAQEVATLTQALDAMQAYEDILSKGIKRHYELNDTQIENLLAMQDQNSVTAYLSRNVSNATIAQNMVMYELMAQEFYFIDIVLKGDENRIWINDVATSVQISFLDLATPVAQTEKKQAIKAAISNIIDKRQGGSSMVFVTLSTNNINVYHYAWAVTINAITELEEKYGAKNYYIAELFIKED